MLPEDVQLADEHLWKPTSRRISHFPRLSTVESVDETLDAATRAGTPGLMEYAHLGSHKHGSLVVTNGPASPSPSVLSKPMSPSKSTADVVRDEDFFTASEGEGRPSSVEDDDFGPPLPQRQYSDLDGLPSQRERIGRLQHRFMVSASNPAARSGSPLKREVREQSEESEDVDVDTLLGPPERQPTPANNGISLANLSFEDMSDDELEMPKVKPIGPHQSAISLASEYIADLPPSPYASAVDVSQCSIPEFESEAERILHEPMQPDEGFYDASPEFEESAQECFEELDHRPPFTREITPETALRSHPPQRMPLRSTIEQTTPPPPTKSDSGYSSEYDSLRSSARSDQRPPVLPTKQHVEIPNPLGGATNVHAYRQMLSNSRSEDALRSLQGSALSTKPEPAPQNSPARSKSWRQSMRKSLPRLLMSESVTSLESKPSVDSKSTIKQEKQPKKLQKKRPLSHQPLSAGFPRHREDGNVPRVPSDVSARFLQRHATAPNMEHLERTCEDAFPNAAKASRLLGDEPPPTPPHRYGFGARGGQRRSRVIEDEEVFTGVVGFGTAAQSLGASPYDLATSGFRRLPLSTATTHPFQPYSVTPQSGLRQGWDDATAVRTAQKRSRERVATGAASANMNEQSVNARPGMPGRPRSHHEASGFTVPRRMRSRDSDIGVPQRPRSMYGDAPAPVPTLDLPVVPPRQRSATPGRTQSIPRYETSNFEHERMPLPEPIRSGEMPAPGTVARLASQIHEISPAPLPPPSNSLDWSQQANVWRQRKLAAQTTVDTTRSSAPFSRTAATPTTRAVTSHPRPQQQSQPKPLVRQLPWLSSAKQQQQWPAASPATIQPEHQQSIPTLPTYAEEGIFGRYGGGTRHRTHYRGLAGKREVSLATGGLREGWGIDLGDVPATRLAV